MGILKMEKMKMKNLLKRNRKQIMMKIVESYVPSKKTGGEGVFYEKKKIVFADSDDEMSSDGEYQSIPNTLEQDEKEDEEMDTIINDDNVSDMDYLRSKMVSKPIIEKEIDVEEDIEESSSDEEEKDEKEEKENKEEMDEDDNEEKEEKQSLFDDEY